MRAIQVKPPGTLDDLEVVELPDLTPGPGEVLVRNFATGLNRADLLQRRGLYPPPPGASEILGLEFAGEVEALGPGAESPWQVGDRVFGLVPGGAYAEQVVSSPDLLLPIPDNFSYESAAAVPEAFLTASQALFELAGLEEGETALVHAGASGVGSAAIQLVKRRGARCIATVSGGPKVQFCRDLGADLVVPYREREFPEVIREELGPRPVHVILDFVGESYWEGNQEVIATDGRWIVLGLLGGSRPRIDLGTILFRRLTVRGLAMRGLPLEERRALTRRFRESALEDLESGKLRPVLDEVFLAEDVREAHARMEAGENSGKIVLRF